MLRLGGSYVECPVIPLEVIQAFLGVSSSSREIADTYALDSRVSRLERTHPLLRLSRPLDLSQRRADQGPLDIEARGSQARSVWVEVERRRSASERRERQQVVRFRQDERGMFVPVLRLGSSLTAYFGFPA